MLLFARNFQTTVYPALNFDEDNVSRVQKKIKEYNRSTGKQRGRKDIVNDLGWGMNDDKWS